MKNLSQKKCKLIAKIWAGSMLAEIDGGFNPSDVDLSDDDLDVIIGEVQFQGYKILKNKKKFGHLKEIVGYVRNP